MCMSWVFSVLVFSSVNFLILHVTLHHTTHTSLYTTERNISPTSTQNESSCPHTTTTITRKTKVEIRGDKNESESGKGS